MALLELQGVGKIYVSDGSVTVGIRGVDLSFERGEFVAVTGKSGSGKSTLLNVISGMDTYEEGELLIEGQPTSHYLQPDWEDYRRDYISFVFQEYNIIESYTVLENVELALMHIDDRRERRARALELIERVGLSDRIHQKGSRLSGGQKQRTVIARALAKDSPIILADEPTGNLDSASAAEIVGLLREVSRDRLLIMVTHSFDEVEGCATRQIRIHDGAVVSDRRLTPSTCESAPTEVKTAPRRAPSLRELAEAKRRDVRNGFTLGRSIFTSRPHLSLFICLLLIVGTLGAFLVTSICADVTDFLDPDYMFSRMDGRVIVASRTGVPLGDAELAALADELGAVDLLHYDLLLDYGGYELYTVWYGARYSPSGLDFAFDEDWGELSVGRYPEAKNEIALRLPISAKSEIGEGIPEDNLLSIEGIGFRVVGISYYYDNTLTPRCSFTREGFESASAILALFRSMSRGELTVYNRFSYSVETAGGTQSDSINVGGSCAVSYEMPAGSIYVGDSAFLTLYQMLKEQDEDKVDFAFDLSIGYSSLDVSLVNNNAQKSFGYHIDGSRLTEQAPVLPSNSSDSFLYAQDISTSFVYTGYDAVLSAELAEELALGILRETYSQASLFFESDSRAREVARTLTDRGYVAVTSDVEYQPDPFETIISTFGLFCLAVVWFATLMTLTFFLNLCLGRAIDAFRGDMAIMRSMGIPVRVIRVGMYVRMLLSLIPAYITVAIAAVAIFATPETNAIFTYLHAWQYLLILVGMLFVIYRLTRRQVRRLFGESVKSAIRGGRDE